MKILDIRTLAGPNVYSYDPALVMKLDLEDLAEKESTDIPGFTDRLLGCLPGMTEHHCSLGRAGGFVERLREGTRFGHIVEHVALELTDNAGISVNRGKTVSTGQRGVYLVAVTYKSDKGMRYLLGVAVELVEALVAGHSYSLTGKWEEARKIVAEAELGPSTRAVVDAAERRGIPWKRVGEDSMVRLGHGRNRRHVQATTSDLTSMIAVDLAADKDLCKNVLAAAGLPVPRGCVVTSVDAAVACFERATEPVVVKPLDGNQGRGVSLNLTTAEQVREAFELAARISPRIIVEEMLRGFDYRVVLVDGRMVAAAQRIPAHVWGDGSHTIRQLIEQVNRDPRRGDNHEKPLTKIAADPLVLATLKRHGRTLEDVPEEGLQVLLRESANLSTGGSAKDVTGKVHPGIRRICERAARAIGLDICGVDLVLPDITRAYESGGIVEVNASPGIRMHHHPSEGQARDVGGAIVDMLYPEGANSRIPIVSITGTNGKTTVSLMTAHAVAAVTGKTVGVTTTEGIWIGEEPIARGDMTGPWSANVVLADPSVEFAVLETARGGIVRSGLGYDWSDVGVMTNIQADHLGQDGIEDVEDVLRIKRLVAERVREGGALVLNADDERLATLPDHPRVKAIPKQYVYISLDAASAVIARHTASGGTAYVRNGDWMEERTGHETVKFARVSDFPAALGGTAEFQISNLLGAIAGCRACGLELHAIVRALTGFRMENKGYGRLNLFGLREGYVVVDYGHNPAAVQAMCRMISQWHATRVSAILTIPGDRSNALIEEFARAAACGFDRIVIREDLDRRGRQPGEVAGIMARVLRAEHPEVPLEIIDDEIEAVSTALKRLQPGEVAVAFCDRVDAVIDTIREHGAYPLSDFQRLVNGMMPSAA